MDHILTSVTPSSSQSKRRNGSVSSALSSIVNSVRVVPPSSRHWRSQSNATGNSSEVPPVNQSVSPQVPSVMSPQPTEQPTSFVSHGYVDSAVSCDQLESLPSSFGALDLQQSTAPSAEAHDENIEPTLNPALRSRFNTITGSSNSSSSISLTRHNAFNAQAYNNNIATSPTMSDLNQGSSSQEIPPLAEVTSNALQSSAGPDHCITAIPAPTAPTTTTTPSSNENPVGNACIQREVQRVIHETQQPRYTVPPVQVGESSCISIENGNMVTPAIIADTEHESNHSSEMHNSSSDTPHENSDTASEGSSDSVSTASAAAQHNHDIRGKADENGFYSIRLTPFMDHAASAPYMFFGPIIRRLKPGMSIPIGRYTEKCKSAATAPQGSSAPIVFKSKVVSRKHALLTVDGYGHWYIKDVSSSSGTFLNHVRMSLANVPSANYKLGNSDILQFGMDYRGGCEEIYRCVKVKVELNYSWRRRGAKFTKEAHERLKMLTLTGKNEELSSCAICLGQIKPCQAVFVSSCSHSWHYKCIRPLIVKNYPQFMCPNCKAICDIEADLDDEDEL